MTTVMHRNIWALPLVALLATVAACAGRSNTGVDGSGVSEGADAPKVAAQDEAGDTSDATTASGIPVKVNLANLRDISPMFYGHNYYNWVPGWGGQVFEVKDLVVPLGLNLLRAGGTPSDTSDPVMFGGSEIDTFVRYAADVGAQPYLQIPFIGMRDVSGALVPATSQNAAEIVRYMNVTHNYGVRYFSIGNEPDIYEDQGQTIGGQPIKGYTAERFCAAFTEYVTAMKAVDPAIRILGPELSWKYRPPKNDWVTPFLRGCGNLVDVVTVHFYPFNSTEDTAEAVLASGGSFRAVIRDVRQLMSNAGHGDKPLGITESAVTWDDDPAKPQLSGAPGSIAAGLWVADALGIAMEEGLWTLDFWSISEAWTLGIIDGRTPKPEYYALLTVRQHFRSKIAKVSGAPAGVSVFAGRNDTSTPVLLVNKTASWQDFNVSTMGGSTQVADVAVTVPPLSLVVIEIPDQGVASAWVYGDAQHSQEIGPQPHALGIVPPSPLPDAAMPRDVTADVAGGIVCSVAMPNAEGNFNIADNFVVASSLHGYASAWTSVGSNPSAVACASPTCVTLLSKNSSAVGLAGPEPTACTPAFPPSALCMAGALTKDPTYETVAGLGFNLNQSTAGDAGAPPTQPKGRDAGDDGGSPMTSLNGQDAAGEAGKSATSAEGIAIPTSITIAVQKLGTANGNSFLRAQLADTNDNYYCVMEGTWTSGKPIPITRFNTMCWNNKGTYATPTTPFKRVDIVVPSSASADRQFSYCMTDVVVQ